MTAITLFQTIRASLQHQLETTTEGKLLIGAGFGDEIKKLMTLAARNAAQAIECELLFADDNDFADEAPTQPAGVGYEAAPGIVVVERRVA